MTYEELQKAYEAAMKKCSELEQKIEEKDLRIEHLTELVLKRNKMLFGQKSEKGKYICDGQMLLDGGIINEAEAKSNPAAPEPTVETVTKSAMKIKFHTMSLPTARLVWHCPFAVLYYSADGQVNGKDYRELTVVRLDGEGWEEDDEAENFVFSSKLEGFTDWNEWKKRNKAGQDCELTYHLEEGSVTITTEYCGLMLRSVTSVPASVPKLYTALTGDQCALTDIHIIR